MDVLRKRASQISKQVSRQQQAVIKQFSGTGYEGPDVVVIDEAELQRHQQLEKLYKSTRSARDFQKNIVRAADTFINIGVKHMETGMKFSEDCCKYGSEHINDGVLAKAASLYGGSLVHLEKQYEELNGFIYSQVLEPLRAMSTGVPLEDARQLAQRYSRMRHEAESQAAEISRRKWRLKEVPMPESAAKLQLAEVKMQELKTNMAVLGKEAAAALTAVESQQQRLTLQRLLAMVEASKSFHLRVAALLDEVESEMSSEKQKNDSAPPPPLAHLGSDKASYFLAEALFPFDAASMTELGLAVGDFIVVRQVTSSGWAEGECRGRAGWFPFAYVEKRHNVPTSKFAPQTL